MCRRTPCATASTCPPTRWRRSTTPTCPRGAWPCIPLHLIDSPTAARSLWQAHQHGAAQRDALLADIELRRPECAAVFRSGDAVLCIPLAAAEMALLRGLQVIQTLGEAMAQATASTEGAALDMSHTLALLLQHHLITDVMPPLSEHPHGD